MARLKFSSPILYEPVPIGRIGVRIDERNKHLGDNEVVVCSDFSPFAFLIEELIASGATTIAVRSSSPDVKAFSQMPPLLKRRIKIIDTSSELESIARLLHGMLKELSVHVDSDTGELNFPKTMNLIVRDKLNRFFSECERLAVGFNHSLQVGIDAKVAGMTAHEFRSGLSDSNSRAILAQFEGIFSCYANIEFIAPVPSISSPQHLVSMFDRLVNDSGYLEFSNAVNQLRYANRRKSALSKIRQWGRNATSHAVFAKSWDYVGKIVKVFTGVPVPESSEIGTIVAGRAFPLLIDLEEARTRAVEMWKTSSHTSVPYFRGVASKKDQKILWAPPLKSAKATHPNALQRSIGNVSELLKALQDMGCAASADRSRDRSP